MHSGNAGRIRTWLLTPLIVTFACAAPAWSQQAAKKTKQTATPSPESAWLKNDAWLNVPTTPLEAGEIDKLLAKELEKSKIVSAPLTTDEQFLRRVRLDLTGQLPTADEVEKFLADSDPAKRAKLIDQLLQTDEYAHHWARYWVGAVAAFEAPFGEALTPDFEEWLYQQFKQDRNWGEIVRSLVTADGSLKKGSKGENGNVFFLGRHSGPDADMARTAETARLFLGIQIQCAQCHNDRRTHIWKQVQFHELAGFFARLQGGGSFGGLLKLSSRPNGEHEMPDRKDATLVFLTPARFLDGKAPPAGASDQDRRRALADFLTAKDNYWFSAAYVNRVWSEMLGQSFFDRVDDLSPKSEVLSPALANRLAAAFAGSDYDIKRLLRAITNSQAYQRQVRLGDKADQHLQFAAVYPTRLRADVLWQALGRALVQWPTTDPLSYQSFKSEFDFDPSLKADEVPASITQALWLLNGTLVNARLKAVDVRLPRPQLDKDGKPLPNDPEPTLLKQALAKHGTDDSAVVRAFYLQTLSRKPTDRELQTCLAYIQETKQAKGTRNDAFEDILKALINSTEFQRKR
jgi:hypothetical protein